MHQMQKGSTVFPVLNIKIIEKSCQFLYQRMAFDETHRTYIITQYPRVTTFYHPDDVLVNNERCKRSKQKLKFC
jgi:hypothetical protein